jgi:hypothetical protein
MPDLVEACKGADILIFVMPHQFVRQTCKTMQEHIKDSALAVSLIKVQFILLFLYAPTWGWGKGTEFALLAPHYPSVD